MPHPTCLALVFAIALNACSDPLDVKCKELSNKFVAESVQKKTKDYTLIETDGFYSKKLDACIHTEVAEVGVQMEIRELSGSVFRDGGLQNHLLYCDADGADSAILEKVREHGGRVFEVPYREWLDDGFGGLPRTIKTPHVPYTKEQCRKVFDKWITGLKS